MDVLEMPVPLVLLRDAANPNAEQWLLFQNPVVVIETTVLEDVLPALSRVDEYVQQGYHAAGFLPYEASPAFDAALTTHAPSDLPLLWFGIFREPERLNTLPHSGDGSFQIGEWQCALDGEEYGNRIQKVRDYIASGDTYQVNYTTRFQADFQGDPYAFFARMNQTQPAPFAAYFDTGRHVFCSGSPELFFALDGERISCRPMKGTCARGLTTADDVAQEKALRESEKDRAENLMIVDMIRNDLGRVAHTGSVQVSSLFDVERYSTVFQMTSTVKAETEKSLPEIFSALFPCASITGAPKVRTMQIIRELEDAPRGIYTGCMGYVAPGRKACFNVAIRTVHIDREKGCAEYGAGGGIVWDSQPQEEWNECQTKAHALLHPRPEFKLFETMLWKPSGFTLLKEHLARLMDSAAYFDFSIRKDEVVQKLREASEEWQGTRRVRLSLARDGAISVEAFPFQKVRPRPIWRVRLAKHPVNTSDVFLYHKTTNRAVYESARAEFNEVEDVLLWNERGEVTESTIANVVVQMDGVLYTPPVSCGLLNGTLRRRLVARGMVQERVIFKEELPDCQKVFLINSLRGWMVTSLQL